MDEVTEYLKTIAGPDRAALENVYRIARDVVGEAVEGTSYAMPALLYRDRGLVTALKNKRFLSLYPYSAIVIAELQEKLADFETTSGSIHFSAVAPIPDDVLYRIVELRCAEIEARRGRPQPM
jgi:uncharacterized protein YdhG (YjbR/CyaY superfamily)